ncbi:MAG: heme-binding domain-containing protein [Chloroflexi bacterium]|nr:heme-binding domain-containing protein [Chloroflexota bacterium]
MAKIILIGLGLALVVTVLMVVIGNLAVERTNPPVTHTINWDSPETERLVRAACFDCHSHETRWPWYAHVAPVAFLLADDVSNARREMNFSTGYHLDVDEMVEKIENGEMPLPNYLMLHPEANLSAEQKAQLIAGLRTTFRGSFQGFRRGSDPQGATGEGSEQGEAEGDD